MLLLSPDWTLLCDTHTHSVPLTEELAVFCKTSRSQYFALHFVPNWAPSFSLSCFMVMALGVFILPVVPRNDWPSPDSLFTSWLLGGS